MNADQIKKEQDIRNYLVHCTGSENHYKNNLYPNFRYTDGVRELIILCDSYWLLTDCLAHCKTLSLNEGFLTIELFKNSNEESCYIIYTDGNENVLNKQVYAYTDFPLNNVIQTKDSQDFILPEPIIHPAVKFYFTNKVLLLPSEY